MNLEKAIKEVKEIKYSQLKCALSDELPEILRKSFLINVEAIDTVLKALDERYQKGYQDGFKQAKFDCEMDKLDGR